MRIDINFQSSAQKLKHKAISNSLRKEKQIHQRGPQPRGLGPLARSARAHTRPTHTGRPAAGDSPRAGAFVETPLRYLVFT